MKKLYILTRRRTYVVKLTYKLKTVNIKYLIVTLTITHFQELELELTEKKDEQEKTRADLVKIKHENDQLRRELQNAGARLKEMSDLTSSSNELNSQLTLARHAEEAERILNQKLNRELHEQKDQVAHLRRGFVEFNFLRLFVTHNF